MAKVLKGLAGGSDGGSEEAGRASATCHMKDGDSLDPVGEGDWAPGKGVGKRSSGGGWW
jgi:hypothetical protein